MTVSLLPAATVNLDSLVNLFNAAYSDYVVPIQLTAEQLRNTFQHYAMDLDASYAAVDGENLVGLGFLAKRDSRGWIGGMGVVPSHRRQGIGRLIMQALLDSARKAGMDTVQLEVIEGNTFAYNLYLTLGFKAMRRLLIAQRFDAPDLIPDASVVVQPSSVHDALGLYDAFHTTPNPWQRECASLHYADDLSAWIAYQKGQPTAYIIGRITPHMIQIMDAASAHSADNSLKTLIAYLHRAAPERPSSMVNLGEDDPVWRVFAGVGYEETMAQLEMVYRVSA